MHFCFTFMFIMSIRLGDIEGNQNEKKIGQTRAEP